MGSFASTCCISGLPLEAGDDVRYFLLTESPYNDSLVCSAHDLYFPRTWPLKAKYNDYGSIEDYDPEGPGVYSIIEGLRKDMIEVGVGNNRVHDVQTRKGMSFEDTLNAVWERRIRVLGEYDTFAEEKKERNDFLRKVTKFLDDGGLDDENNDVSGEESRQERAERLQPWRPTLQRVSQLLRDNDFKVNSGYGDGGYLVNEQGNGWVRVRSGGFGEGEPLRPVKDLLQNHYAVMITCGSGNYSQKQELQVMPLPGEPGEHRSFLNKDSKKSVRVFQCMIHEEIWQAIISTSSFKKQRDKLQAEWDAANKPDDYSDVKDPELRKMYLKMDEEGAREFGYVGSPLRDHVPFTMGCEQHFRLVVKRHRKQPFTDEQIKIFLDNVAGMVCLHEVLYPIRYWWRPTFSVGPQFGEYSKHAKWAELMYKVTQKVYRDKKIQYEENYGVE